MTKPSARLQRPMPLSRKLLCGAYATIALVALLATWRNGGPYIHSISAFLLDFWKDTKANSASRFITADILMFGLAAAVLIVIEGRRHKVRLVWAYIVGSFLVGVSVCFPLFLIAREVRTKQADPLELRTLDTTLLGVLAVAMVALTMWIDIG